ncbi:MAG TPA: MATE family efflux transporter [Bryobacteraceae bacterium]|jgi:MATE family multidrug resistance protein|nr:MATE family efflux transporter [Bryobacteraceae bacterium]
MESLSKTAGSGVRARVRDALRQELRPMATLAAPLVLAEVGWMAMGVVDTMMVGRVGAEAVAAVSLGTMVFYAVGMFASGLLLGLDTLVAQAYGAQDRVDCRRSLVNGVWLAIGLVPIVMAVIAAFPPLLAVFGIDPAVRVVTGPYLWALNWSTPALLGYFAFRRYLQSVNVVRPVTLVLVSANLVNVAGNWLLVFGHWGFPRMGAEGSGWATCLSRFYMAIGLGVVIWRHDHRALFEISWRPHWERIRELLRLGMPAALQIGLETGVFATVTVLVGKLGAIALASHQVALMTVSMTFMLPLGISSAASVRVGHALGARDSDAAIRAGWTAMALGAAVMSAAGLALTFFPHWIARSYTPDEGIVVAGAAILQVAALFQLFDGLQIVATGALRGAGDTRTPMLCHFTGYWVIGLPLGALLCFHFGMGARGLWIGLTVGLIVIGLILLEGWRRATLRFPR